MTLEEKHIRRFAVLALSFLEAGVAMVNGLVDRPDLPTARRLLRRAIEREKEKLAEEESNDLG